MFTLVFGIAFWWWYPSFDCYLRCARTIAAHRGSVNCLAVNPQETMFATGGDDGIVRTWSLPLYEASRFLSFKTPVSSLAISPDGVFIAVGLYNGRISVYSLADAQQLVDFQAHDGPVVGLSYAPGGDVIASETAFAPAELWSSKTGASIGRLMSHESGGTAALAFIESGSQLVAPGASRGGLLIWDVESRSQRLQIAGPEAHVGSLAVSPRGDVVAAGTWHSQIHLFSLVERRHLKSWRAHETPINSGLVFSKDGSLLASGVAMGNVLCVPTLKVWSVETGASVDMIRMPRFGAASNGFTALGFVADSNVLSTHADGRIRVWRIRVPTKEL